MTPIDYAIDSVRVAAGKLEAAAAETAAVQATALATAAAALAATPPVLTIAAPAAAAEGNSGAKQFVFVATLSKTWTSPIAVAWATSGTGSSPAEASDFTGGVFPSGTFTFAAGETSKNIVVSVAGDTTIEPNENFLLTATPMLQLGAVTATATIVNDDNSAVPDAPTLTATGGDGKVTLTWADGATGGAAITGHTLYAGASADALTLVGTITTGSPYVDTPVTNGAKRYYALSAVNSVGEGPRSNVVNATPAAAALVNATRLGVNIVDSGYGGQHRILTNQFSEDQWRADYDHNNAVPALDTSGNLANMTAGTPYRKIMGRPNQNGGPMVILWSGTGDAVLESIQIHTENGGVGGTITNLAINNAAKKATFNFAPGDATSVWGYKPLFRCTTSGSQVMQPWCSEADANGNPVTLDPIYPQWVARHQHFSTLRDLDFGNALGTYSQFLPTYPHTWAERTPDDNIRPSRVYRSAALSISGLNLQAFGPQESPFYCRQRLHAKVMDQMGDANGPKGIFGSQAHVVRVQTLAASGSGSQTFVGPDGNGDFLLTITPPSTVSTVKNFIDYLQSFGYQDSNYSGVVGNWTVPGANDAERATNGAAAYVPAGPVRFAGGTMPLNREDRPFSLKVKAINAINKATGNPCNLWIVLAPSTTVSYIQNMCQAFKDTAHAGSKLLLEINNEPWNEGLPFQMAQNYLAAVGMSSASYGPTNTGDDLRAPVNSDEPSTTFVYGLAHIQKKLFPAAVAILGTRVERISGSEIHGSGPYQGKFNMLFNTLGAYKYTDHPTSADYEYAPFGSDNSMGQWVTGKAYGLYNYFTDQATDNLGGIYWVAKPHTSTSIAADLAAGNIVVMTPDSIRVVMLNGQYATVQVAVKWDAACQALPNNDRGVKPNWCAYEGGATGPDLNTNYNGTSAQNDYHYQKLNAFYKAYYQSAVKQECENYHNALAMALLPNLGSSYRVAYADQGGDPTANRNGSYQIMRDLWSDGTINRRWQGGVDSQAGRLFGFFKEGPTALPTLMGQNLPNQTITYTPLTPLNTTTSGWYWRDGNNNIVQTGGLTFTNGATAVSGLNLIPWFTDVLRGTTKVYGYSVAATAIAKVLDAKFTPSVANTAQGVSTYKDDTNGSWSYTGTTEPVVTAAGKLSVPNGSAAISGISVPANKGYTIDFDVDYSGGIASWEFDFGRASATTKIGLEVRYDGKMQLVSHTPSQSPEYRIFAGFGAWPNDSRPTDAVHHIQITVDPQADGSILCGFSMDGVFVASGTESIVTQPGAVSFNGGNFSGTHDNLVISAKL